MISNYIIIISLHPAIVNNCGVTVGKLSKSAVVFLKRSLTPHYRTLDEKLRCPRPQNKPIITAKLPFYIFITVYICSGVSNIYYFVCKSMVLTFNPLLPGVNDKTQGSSPNVMKVFQTRFRNWLEYFIVHEDPDHTNMWSNTAFLVYNYSQRNTAGP